jgi:hypothetical protein
MGVLGWQVHQIRHPNAGLLLGWRSRAAANLDRSMSEADIHSGNPLNLFRENRPPLAALVVRQDATGQARHEVGLNVRCGPQLRAHPMMLPMAGSPVNCRSRRLR